MAKKEWCDWLKCNVLEIIILILVLVLVIKVFSAPEAAKETLVVEEAPAPTEPIGETITPPAAEGTPSEEIPAAGAGEGITG